MKVMFLAWFGCKRNFCFAVVAISWYEAHEWFNAVYNGRKKPQYNKSSAAHRRHHRQITFISFRATNDLVFSSVFVDWLAWEKKEEFPNWKWNDRKLLHFTLEIDLEGEHCTVWQFSSSALQWNTIRIVHVCLMIDFLFVLLWLRTISSRLMKFKYALCSSAPMKLYLYSAIKEGHTKLLFSKDISRWFSVSTCIKFISIVIVSATKIITLIWLWWWFVWYGLVVSHKKK